MDMDKTTKMQTAHSHDATNEAILQLAKDLECDADYVAEVYWGEHMRLSNLARLPDYVPLFATRFSRDRIIHNKRLSS